MKYDDILLIVGEFGLYQKRLYVALVFPSIFLALQTMNYIFIFGHQDHKCNLPIDDYDTNTSMINETSFGGEQNSTLYSKNESVLWSTECETHTFYNATNTTVTQTCTKWEYDTSTYTLSATSEFDLVCGNKAFKSIASMVNFCGVFSASLIMGTLGDIIGRRLVLCTSVSVMFISNLALAWSPDIHVFSAIYFVTGFFNFAYFSTAVIIVLELVGPSKRTFVGIVIEFVFCFGELILCGIAYFIRNWRYLQITISAPSFILLFYWLIIPESPRWLLAKGKTDEARLIIKKIADVNKTKYPENLNIIETERKLKLRDVVPPLIKSKTLVFRWIIMTFCWFVIVFSYFGLSYSVGRLGGNVYLNFLLSIVVETVGYFLCFIFSGRFGRKVVHCCCLVLSGAACLATIFTEIVADESFHWMTITLAMIGKCGISAAFGNIYIYTPELFPTYVRSFTLGACNVGARLGSITSPYVANMADFVPGKFGKALPLIIFGSCAILAGIVSLLTLPETLNKKLPENINDAILLQRKPTQNVEQNINNPSETNAVDS